VYEAGFTSIAPFYPDFETSPEDLPALDTEKFRKMVDRKFGDNAFSDPDPYIMQEYERGYFEDENVREVYLEMCGLLITPLQTLLPAYYNKTGKGK
jgi:exodeoxyribonuclease V gamma subunit